MAGENQRARRIMEEMDLTPEERKRLVGVLRVALDTVDSEYRANVAAVARDLERSRRTVYSWTDRVLITAAQVLRDIRVGRPSKEEKA